jgi:hypothetical protein
MKLTTLLQVVPRSIIIGYIYIHSPIHPEKGCHLDVVGGPSTSNDAESDAGGSLSSW